MAVARSRVLRAGSAPPRRAGDLAAGALLGGERVPVGVGAEGPRQQPLHRGGSGRRPRRGGSRRARGSTRRSGRRHRRPDGQGATGSRRWMLTRQVHAGASSGVQGESVWSIIPALTTEIAQTKSRRTATELVRGLAARGHVIGDNRVAGGSAGVYEHHDPGDGRGARGGRSRRRRRDRRRGAGGARACCRCGARHRSSSGSRSCSGSPISCWSDAPKPAP